MAASPHPRAARHPGHPFAGRGPYRGRHPGYGHAAHYRPGMFVVPVLVLLGYCAITVWLARGFRSLSARAEAGEAMAGWVEAMATWSGERAWQPAAGPAASLVARRPTLAFLPPSAIVAAALCAGALVSLLLMRPAPRRLIDDPRYGVDHNGVDTPALDHMAPLLLVCPGDHARLLDTFRAWGISTLTPPVEMVRLSDSPSGDQIERARSIAG